ncbi:hypothetical protein HJG60_012108 [Phyllostomus discolor]|uniref:Uncharacterized protein n=1 Tax=Phyllostomus discolor TaxID=89673 RepID=A0A834DWE6_9CHIR|nr:hypothetical protein HJG60_012108 [Phyllostomus discolor]
MGMGVKPGGCSGSTHLVQGRSSRAPSMTYGTATLEPQMVEALSSFSQHWAAVPLTSVSRWSTYPSIQTWGFGRSRPIPRAFPLHLITSVLGSVPLDITVTVDIDSIWIVQKCPKSLLYTAAQPGN